MSSQNTSRPKELAGFQSATTTMNAVRLHYWVGGNPNGPPVLLWHGFLGTSYVWNKVMPNLARRVTRSSLPICGATVIPTNQQAQLDTMAGRSRLSSVPGASTGIRTRSATSHRCTRYGRTSSSSLGR